jgi:predicted proteasome-type protease
MGGVEATATFIVGGQIEDKDPEILLVDPEGNYIRASDELPFLQIGEAKYGKFLLEMAARFEVSAETAIKIALGSMMSTARANLSVGPPYDLGVYGREPFTVDEYRIEADSRVLADLQATGSDDCGRASPSCRASPWRTWRGLCTTVSDPGPRRLVRLRRMRTCVRDRLHADPPL